MKEGPALALFVAESCELADGRSSEKIGPDSGDDAGTPVEKQRPDTLEEVSEKMSRLESALFLFISRSSPGGRESTLRL